MVTLSNADKALKSFYLDAVSEALNIKINPFLAKIEKTSTSIVGKNVRKRFVNGYNAGVATGTEDGELPPAVSRTYREIVAPLKNFYGTLEISDKALRASAGDGNGFVNLLNEEMQSLINSAKLNFGRMLFGNGSGVLSTVIKSSAPCIVVSDPQNFVKGMRVWVQATDDEIYDNIEIIEVFRKPIGEESSILVRGIAASDIAKIGAGSLIYLEGPTDRDLTGLDALFNSDYYPYGVSCDLITGYGYMENEVGEITEEVIQRAMDNVEIQSGRRPNYILCSWGVRRAIQAYYKNYSINLPTMELENGETALSFYGVPIVVDKFCPEGMMYLLNTDSFKLYQLCDWEWLETEDGKILRQIPGKAAYSATLVKYAELICEDTAAQGRLTGITVR